MDALVSSGSNVRPCHYRVRLYDVSQPPFLLEHQLSSCWRDAGVSSSFNCVQSFLNRWQTLWKYIIQFGWCNAARPERFMINFEHLHPLYSVKFRWGWTWQHHNRFFILPQDPRRHWSQSFWFFSLSCDTYSISGLLEGLLDFGCFAWLVKWVFYSWLHTRSPIFFFLLFNSLSLCVTDLFIGYWVLNAGIV